MAGRSLTLPPYSINSSTSIPWARRQPHNGLTPPPSGLLAWRPHGFPTSRLCRAAFPFRSSPFPTDGVRSDVGYGSWGDGLFALLHKGEDGPNGSLASALVESFCLCSALFVGGSHSLGSSRSTSVGLPDAS